METNNPSSTCMGPQIWVKIHIPQKIRRLPTLWNFKKIIKTKDLSTYSSLIVDPTFISTIRDFHFYCCNFQIDFSSMKYFLKHLQRSRPNLLVALGTPSIYSQCLPLIFQIYISVSYMFNLFMNSKCVFLSKILDNRTAMLQVKIGKIWNHVGSKPISVKRWRASFLRGRPMTQWRNLAKRSFCRQIEPIYIVRITAVVKDKGLHLSKSKGVVQENQIFVFEVSLFASW